ncbi:adenosylcobinamide-phosphate synthase CbiB [Chitinophaga qingshengii]|uniref:Cobalamin biosynthesis protein CobD n=1 Tax=Chitinophaga qingshengii TaxID=1569794 RepID=A0ABR7TIW7_9BACT|nr:adenosylcobinamide-phosphate synthase CbiB [Chitinophaga qingshengii]MBC9929354.1 cobalamin biosynthesis protein CobD [Chitinophaga qingshengii]
MDAYLKFVLPLLLGYVADLLLGDPRKWPHPVKGYGQLIAWTIRWLNRGQARLWKGALMTTVLCALVFGGFYYIVRSLQPWPWASTLFSAVMVFFALANKSLLQEGCEVFDTLEHEGLEAGRRRLSWIVGRDTSALSPNQIRIAVMESMSENLNDGVIAPLFYYAVLGVPGMMLYKMINTLDSMVGYKNDQYRYFGRVAARLDDVANFIPARLTALLMILVTGSGRAARYVIRFGSAHASPNAGYPEAALAGILHCRFGGPNTYHGQVVVKPYIGEQARDIAHAEFRKVRYVNHATTFLMIVLICGVCYLMIL